MTSSECPTEFIHYLHRNDNVGRLYNEEQNITSNLKPPIQKKEFHPHYGNFQLVGHGFIAHAQ